MHITTSLSVHPLSVGVVSFVVALGEFLVQDEVGVAAVREEMDRRPVELAPLEQLAVG